MVWTTVPFAVFFFAAAAGSPIDRNQSSTVQLVPSEYNAEVIYYTMAAAWPLNDTSGAAAPGGRPGSATDEHSCDRVRAVPSHLRSAQHMYPHGLGQFYQKYTEAYGIPVLGSRYLSDSALQRACYVVRFVMADNYDVRNSYYKKYGRFALMGVNEVTTHIPEHTSLGSWWDSRARGLGATLDRPVSTGGEENALCYSSDRYRQEDIILHEFAHGAHLLGSYYAIAGFQSQLRSLYTSARARGLWANTYALTDEREYWAEGVQSYFNVEAYANPPNGIHNHVNTRTKLQGYDPGLYNLIASFFSCGNDYIKRCENNRENITLKFKETPTGAELSQDLKLNCAGSRPPVTPTTAITTTLPSTTASTTPTPPPTPVECADTDDRCSAWADDGWCGRAPVWMRANCTVSCEACDTVTEPATTTMSTTTTTTTQPPRPDCVDYNVHCVSWAARGECSRNPAYMLVYCRRSCNQC